MKKVFALLTFAVCFTFSINAQRTVSGTITDTNGEALIGANVIVSGTTIGTITDLDGSFNFEVPDDAKTVVVSYTGFDSQTIDISEQSVINLILTEGQLLDEVVVTGYGTSKKSDVVSAISTVDGDAIQNMAIASVDQLLQGKSTGVEVTAINGKPGQRGYFRIRGLTSINGNNDPLYIVDGVPVPTTVFSAINPNDIEDFTILKDAGALAIYGARASAGVVLITTKSGDSKNSFVEYTIQKGSKRALDDGFTLMNAEEKLDYEIALGVRPILTSEERADILRFGTDWENELLRTGDLTSHNLSFSGGNEKGNYFLSLSRYDEEGISLGSDYDRTTGKFNGSYKINDWVTITNNLSISNRNDNELRDRYNVQSPFVGLYVYNPYETIFNLDENGDPLLDESGNPDWNFTHVGFNIVEAIQNNPEKNEWSDLYGSIDIRLTPIKNFSFTTRAGYTYNQFEREYWNKPGSILDFYVGDPDAPGTKTDGGSDTERILWNNVATYDFNINDNSRLSLLAGTEYVQNRFESWSVSSKGFPVGLSVQSVASEVTGGNTTRTEWAIFSTFGQVAYALNDALHVEASVRRDGSSRFGKNSRFGTFWGVSAGYNFARTLLVDNNTFDQLKLRASYGTSGNEPTGLYDAIGQLDFGSYNDQPASLQGNVANPNLQWETQKSYSIGIDYGILNNRLTGSLELYNKLSADLLFPAQLSRTTGFTSRTENIGDLRNKGFEVELNYNPIRTTDITDLDVNIGVRFSKNRSTIDKLNTDEINPSNAFGSLLKAGEVAYVWNLVEFVEIDPMTGDAVYLDAEGSRTTAPTESDSRIMSGKSALPTYFGGFDFQIGYKGFSVRTDFVFKGGNYIYNQRKRDLLSGLDGARDNQITEAFTYWKQPGDITDIPRPEVEVEPADSDRFLEKGDYVRLRNLQIGYDLPRSIVSKLKVQNINLFIAGTNLATWSNFIGDPEVGVFIEESASSVGGQLPGEYAGFSYPNTRSFTGGLTVKF